MKNWKVVTFTVTGLVLGAAASWAVGDHFGLDRNTWPAWVQAVGAIAAIAVAFVVTHIQERNAFKQHVRASGIAAKERLGGILAIVEHAHSLLRELSEYPIGNDEIGIEFRKWVYTQFDKKIAYAEKSLNAIPLHEVNSYVVVLAIQEITSAVEDAKADVLAVCDSVGPQFGDHLAAATRKFDLHLSAADMAFENVSIARNSVPMTVIE
jgi:hypothetical protein